MGADAWLPSSRPGCKFRSRQAPPPAFVEDFEKTWEHYPNKVGKAAALAAYQARRRAGVTFDELMKATMMYAAARRGEDPTYTMRGKTFYGPQERWKEPIEAKRANGTSAASTKDLTKRVLPSEVEDEAGDEIDFDDPLRDL